MKKYPKLIISLIIGITVFLLWAFPYRAGLNYHEELQFFLIDDNYLLDHLHETGGFAVYLSEALVQFYRNHLYGAAILGIEFMLIYLLSAGVVKRLPEFKGKNLLSFVPVIVLLVLIGDVNVMHSLIIAVLLGLLLLFVVLSICKSLTYRILGLFVALPIFWWMCWTSHYRIPDNSVKIVSIYNSKIYDVLEYDMYVREKCWDEIIEKAEKSKPTSLTSMCATNLALGMKNKLLTKGTKLNRFGVKGLVPMFDHNPLMAFTIAETYFHLGMVNSAQRMYFESMEAIYNRNKSARCISRLAETNIINGHYEVAKKYLRLLQKTLFYKEWATNRLKMIESGEDAIMADKLYGRLRNECLRQDFLYNDVDMIDGVFGNLFVRNPDNSLAMQYLLIYAALEGNAEKYNTYYDAVKKYRPDAIIPIPKNNATSVSAPLMPSGNN